MYIVELDVPPNVLIYIIFLSHLKIYLITTRISATEQCEVERWAQTDTTMAIHGEKWAIFFLNSTYIV